MSNQYFENNENLSSNIVELSYYFKKTKMRFLSDNGVFSKSGVDFGSAAPKNIEGYFRGVNDGTVHVRIDAIDGDDVAVINVKAAENFIAAHADFNKSITGVHDVFFVFEGEGYQFEKWCVEV